MAAGLPALHVAQGRDTLTQRFSQTSVLLSVWPWLCRAVAGGGAACRGRCGADPRRRIPSCLQNAFMKTKWLGAPGWLGWSSIPLSVSARVMTLWFVSLSPVLGLNFLPISVVSVTFSVFCWEASPFSRSVLGGGAEGLQPGEAGVWWFLGHGSFWRWVSIIPMALGVAAWAGSSSTPSKHPRVGASYLLFWGLGNTLPSTWEPRVWSEVESIFPVVEVGGAFPLAK